MFGLGFSLSLNSNCRIGRETLNQITCALPLTGAIAGLVAGQTPQGALNPALYELSSYATSGLNDEIIVVDVLFVINGVAGFDGDVPVAEGDTVLAVMNVFDSSGLSAIFTSNTVQVAAGQSQLLAFVANPDATAKIQWLGDSFDMTVAAPSRLAGSATITSVVAAAGPVSVRAPNYTGVAGVGQTLVIENTLFLNDNSLASPVLSYRHQRDGVDIPGATSASYVVTSADQGASLRGVVEASDANGSSGDIFTSALAIPAAQTFVRQSVRANGAAYLTHNTPLPAAAPDLLFFVQMTPDTGRQALLSLNGTALALGLYDGPAVRSTWKTDTNGSINSGIPTITPGQRIAVLGRLAVQGSDILYSNYYLREGETMWIAGNAQTAGGAAINLAQSAGFRFFAQTGSTNWQFTGKLHRYAMWAGLGTPPDISQLSVQSNFLSVGTDDLIHPDVSVAAFGTPLFDLNGAAAEYNAGTVNGSIGTIDTVTGSFTDA